MKKITVMMALMVAMAIGYASNSFAECANGSYFCNFQIVDNSTSSSWTGATIIDPDVGEVPVLNLTQTPVLYFKLSSALDKIDGMWIKEGNSPYEPFGNVSPSNPMTAEGWMTPAMWASLSTSSKLGNWSVLGHIMGTDSWTLDQETGALSCPTCAIANFVVTPEPMSMVLYGMGGLPLAAHFLRRRKIVA